MANTQSGAGGLLFVDRGDPASADYGVNDFIRDLSWHDMDLSSIVPAGAILVLLRLVINYSGTADSIQFRKKGNVNTKNTACVTSQVENKNCTDDVWVAPNANGVIEYRTNEGTWTTLDLTVAGWFV